MSDLILFVYHHENLQLQFVMVPLFLSYGLRSEALCPKGTIGWPKPFGGYDESTWKVWAKY